MVIMMAHLGLFLPDCSADTEAVEVLHPCSSIDVLALQPV